MRGRDLQDVVGGAILMLIGAFAAVYALKTLNLGTMARIGPGMFPAALGCILGAFGAGILVPALFRTNKGFAVFDLRSFVAILASILAFAVMVGPFGLIPAVAALTLIASRADSKLSVIGTVLVAAGLSLGSFLIFRMGLGLPVAAISWQW